MTYSYQISTRIYPSSKFHSSIPASETDDHGTDDESNNHHWISDAEYGHYDVIDHESIPHYLSRHCNPNGVGGSQNEY